MILVRNCVTTFAFIISLSIYGSEVYAPFGTESQKVPSIDTIKLIDAKIGVSAQQVCGYTDWTTAQLHIPKQLLSSQYYKTIGKKMINSAKRSFSNLSGALVPMMACNMSSTFCALMNHSKSLAALELSMTKDDCKMLDGLANVDGLQSIELKNCIQQTMSSYGNISAGQAREACLVNDNDAGKVTSKGRKNETANSKSGNPKNFDLEKFLRSIFPNKLKVSNSRTVDIGNSKYKFSRSAKSYSLAKELLPGLSIHSKLSTLAGGTFQPVLENEISRETERIQTEINEVILKLYPFIRRGESPYQVLKRLKAITNDPNREKVSPLLRERLDGGEPSFAVAKEQIIQVISMYDELPSKEADLDTPQGKVIQQISKAASFMKIADRLTDVLTRARVACNGDPRLRDKLSQVNCNILLANADANMKSLDLMLKVEEMYLRNQERVGKIVSSVQQSSKSRKKHYSDYRETPKESSTQIEIPYKR